MDEPKEMQNVTMEAQNPQPETEATLSEQTPEPLAVPTAENTQSNAPETEAEPTENQPQAIVEEQPVEADAENDSTPEAEIEEEPAVDYSAFSREELTEALKELLQTDDITKIKNRVGAIKLRFAEADKEAKVVCFKRFSLND